MSGGSVQRLFQLKHNPLTGNSEWIVIEENEEFPDNFSDGLLASTSYLDMLNDSRRNRAFRLAIEKTVTKPCHVLDIGAGTGLLSMMAARAMGLSNATACPNNKGVVTACESYLPMVKLMRKVLHLNGMGKHVNVINKRSDELKVGVDIASRADVLVSEILDSELLGEGLIPTLQHAHDMLLVENPQTVPYRAVTYGQLVESTFLSKLNDLHNNEEKALDGIHLVPTGFNTIPSVKSQQYTMHCDAIREEIKLLSEPFEIFEFDFWKRPDSYGETGLHIKAINKGTVHAIVSWWVLQLDHEGTIFYSTAPSWIRSEGAGDWCDHWKQCVWFLPGEGLSVTEHEEVLLHAVHTDTSMSYELKAQVERPGVMQYNVNDWNLQLMLPPERIAIYGDSKWRLCMLTAIRNALQSRSHPLCLVVDDSVFLTLVAAHLSKSSHVLSLFPGLQEKGARYLEAVAYANNFSMDRLEVSRKGKAYLTGNSTYQRKVDLLLGEPYYFGKEGALPWQNLRFWKERTMLDSILAKDAVIVPYKGILKACAMYLPNLWISRHSLRKIEGFDHSIVNMTLGSCGDLPTPKEGPCLPFFVWQCGEITALSEMFTIMEFDFSKPASPCSGKAQVEFIEDGICHGFVLWIDWVMDTENSIVISTGPDERYWKQGVKLLSKPVAVQVNESGGAGGCGSAVVEASFDPSSNGDLIIKHIFS